jgi:hypothetical protein
MPNVMECITDFKCLETVAKLAPIGTALIALGAATIALIAIGAQIHIARRRAAIDFFLKTEIDRTAIDLYKAFKEHAPSMSSIPSISIEPVATHYIDIRSWLNICELIAVGVNKDAFSKSVSLDYWGDVIPSSYRTAEPLINDIRSKDGSKHTYVELEKLAKRWDKGTAGGSMRRGLFRLWVVLTVLWIAGGAWLLWDDLTAKLRPEDLAANASVNPPLPGGFILETILDDVHKRRIHAVELVLVPPLGLLVLGCLGFWVGRGFR